MKMFLIILSVIGVLVGQVSSICHPRDFGHGSNVCVCSESQKCDGEFHNINIPATDHSVVIGIRSSKAGDRFLKQEFRFAKEEPKSNEEVIKVQIDATKKFQKIIGFGAAFTDSAGAFIAKLPKDLQERLMRDFFADDGIGYRLGRVPIGGTDFSPRGYSLDDHENDDTLEKFALQPEDFNFKIPYLKMAQEISGNKVLLFGSAWAAPAWMKTNHKLNLGGFLIGEPGGKYYKLYAKYLVKFLQAYQNHSLPMWGITTCNEPQFGYNPTWGNNVIGFNGTLQRDFVKMDLGPILKEAGYGTDKLKLMILDDNSHKLIEFGQAVLSDPEAAKYVSGVAFHWYDNGNTVDAQIKPLDTLGAAFSNVFYLNTEACELRAVQLGNWTAAERYAGDIINDLNHHTAGWVEWNIVLEHGSAMDANIIVDEKTKEYYKQPTYYTMGLFSKFLVPDSVRLQHTIAKEDHNTLITVFQRPDGAKVATVLNRNAHAVKVELHDPANGYVLVELPEHSIESFIWH